MGCRPDRKLNAQITCEGSAPRCEKPDLSYLHQQGSLLEPCVHIFLVSFRHHSSCSLLKRGLFVSVVRRAKFLSELSRLVTPLHRPQCFPGQVFFFLSLVQRSRF